MLIHFADVIKCSWCWLLFALGGDPLDTKDEGEHEYFVEDEIAVQSQQL